MKVQEVSQNDSIICTMSVIEFYTYKHVRIERNR